MPNVDVTTFLREVIVDLDDVPEGFVQRLVVLLDSAPTTRWTKIRDLLEEVTRG